MQVSGRIWEHVVASLHALKEPSALIAWLPSHQADGKAGAAAALLGNLAQVSASALQVKCSALPALPGNLGCVKLGFVALLTMVMHAKWQAMHVFTCCLSMSKGGAGHLDYHVALTCITALANQSLLSSVCNASLAVQHAALLAMHPLLLELVLGCYLKQEPVLLLRVTSAASDDYQAGAHTVDAKFYQSTAVKGVPTEQGHPKIQSEMPYAVSLCVTHTQ